MRVFLSGGTGFVGREIVSALLARGDEVSILSRRSDVVVAGASMIEGDPNFSGAWQQHLSGHDAVINLAGAPIDGRRWNAEYENRIRLSRVETTRHLVEAIGDLPSALRPRVLASSSGIDYYPFAENHSNAGAAGDRDVGEDEPSGSSSLARTCADWEAEALRATESGVRTIQMRLGMVLGDGGALPRMRTPFEWGVGGRMGSGRQWVSWIHIDDVVAAFLSALDQEGLVGPVNLVAPEPVRNREFTKVLARTLHRPAVLPIPAFLLRIVVGGLAEYILYGRKAVPACLLAHNFEFKFPELAPALADLAHARRT